MYYSHRFTVSGNYQRCPAGFSNAVYNLGQIRRNGFSLFLYVRDDGIAGSFTDTQSIHINTAHACLSGKRYEMHTILIFGIDSPAQTIFLFS